MKETKYISYEEPINGRSFTYKQMQEVYRDLANKEEYGLSEEQLLALGEDPEKQEEPQEMWDGDFDFLMDFWF